MDMDNGSIEILKTFALAFLPLFVAMEPVGIMPVYLSMTRQMAPHERSTVLFYSVLTAAAITIAFLVVGKAVFFVLGITIKDFQIAGGLILLSIAISDIVQTARGIPDIIPTTGIGIVPIGTPMIAGPAALTTLLMISDLYGFTVTLAALVTNLIIIWFVFIWADTVVRYTGESGARGISKVVSLLLAAIAVMMIRKGIEGFLR
ncbi:MAG: MarC family protein [Deltaproteobacteria bacterium]|nr:MarC family protein [Deltaproteobacteria bacterium]